MENHNKAKILTLVPAVVLLVVALVLGPMTIDYFSTGSDVTAVALIFVGTLCLIITTVPCLVMSVVGMVSATKAKKEGVEKSHKFFVVGIIETVIFGMGVISMIVVVLITVLAVFSRSH